MVSKYTEVGFESCDGAWKVHTKQGFYIGHIQKTYDPDRFAFISTETGRILYADELREIADFCEQKTKEHKVSDGKR